MRSLTIASVIASVLCAAPASALDLNSFRAQHHRPPLSLSIELSGIASAKARELADRRRLDHNGFRERARIRGSASAENVAFGCATEDCVIKMWSRSASHRRNMLMGGISAYGIGSATGSNGRTYWALELGN